MSSLSSAKLWQTPVVHRFELGEGMQLQVYRLFDDVLVIQRKKLVFLEFQCHFDLSSSLLQVNVSRAMNACAIIEIQLINCSRSLILHWGCVYSRQT